MSRRELLEEAIELICGDRNVQYGNPNDDFKTTASLWTAYVTRKKARHPEEEFAFDAEDVAVMMILLKVSRLSWSPLKKDHWLDIAGYAACGWDCVSKGNLPVKEATDNDTFSPTTVEFMEDKIVFCKGKFVSYFYAEEAISLLTSPSSLAEYIVKCHELPLYYKDTITKWIENVRSRS